MIYGIIGLIQALFVPGALVLFEAQKKKLALFSFLEWVLLSIPLSLVINFLFYYWLVGVFHFSPVYVLGFLLALEGTWILRVTRHFNVSIFRAEKGSPFRLHEICFLGLSLSQFLYFLRKPLDVMWGWDGALSWQRWAIDWFHGVWPVNTWKYPQLIPATWAVIYTFLGTCDIQIFSRFLTNLFPVLAALAWLMLYRRTRAASDFLAGVFTLIFFNLYIPTVLFTDGMVDFSLLFFVEVSFVSLRIFQLNEEEPLWLYLFLLFGIMSSSVKQGGLVWLIFVMGVGIATLIKKPAIRKSTLKQIAWLIAISATSLSWYIFKQIEIIRGVDFSETAWIAKGLYAQLSPLNRFGQAMNGIFTSSLPRVTFSFLFFSGILFKVFDLKNSNWLNRLLLVFSIVFFIGWGLFFSYLGDPKNLGFAIPMLCFYSASGWYAITSVYPRFFKKNVIIPLVSIVVLFLVGQGVSQNRDWLGAKLSLYSALLASAGVGFFIAYKALQLPTQLKNKLILSVSIFSISLICVKFSLADLGKIQSRELERQGLPHLNEAFRSAIQSKQVSGHVYSDYGFFKVLPDFRNYYYFVPERFSLSFLKRIESGDYSFQFILVRKSGRMYDNLGPHVMGNDARLELDTLLQSGRAKLIFEATDPSPEYGGDLETFQLIRMNTGNTP